MAIVRSPLAGQVIEIHTRRGERVGGDGIAELGRTDSMYAVAEVYETDIGAVKIGAGATITSPALSEPLHGTVESIALKIGKADVLNTDPAAKIDARVVEVDIRLDDSKSVRGLTNLQVEIVIER
jgi:HlyD family secretion protein